MYVCMYIYIYVFMYVCITYVVKACITKYCRICIRTERVLLKKFSITPREKAYFHAELQLQHYNVGH